ncbi:MAG TPA: hypothetical protein VHF26_14105 [Trebonia sp.]|nr:hypothetical protein [Trebonia sp.]
MTAPTLAAGGDLFEVDLFEVEDDPDTPSDGLTLDTPHGPVDLIAVQRALAGRPVELTRAEHRYIAALIRNHQARRPKTRR